MFTVMVPIVGFYFFCQLFYKIFGENDYFKLNVIYISNGKYLKNPLVVFVCTVRHSCNCSHKSES